jgi:RNA polymerase sigma factor (sigma-70 family)
MMRQLINCIEEMPGNIATILKQYYLQGKNYKKIAAELNSTPDAIRMQKARAIKQLKAKLLSSGKEP